MPDDAEQRFKRAGLLLTMQAHGLRKRLLHTGSRAALLPVTDDADSVLALLVCARTMDLLGRARHDVLAVTQPEGDRARVLRLCKALGVSVRPNADHAGLARTHAALPLAAAHPAAGPRGLRRRGRGRGHSARHGGAHVLPVPAAVDPA